MTARDDRRTAPLREAGRRLAARLAAARSRSRSRPFQYGTAPDLEARIAALEASARWPAGRLRALGLERRRRAALHAFDHVPFYRERYRAAGLRRADLARDEAAFAALPAVSKADVREHGQAFLDPGVPQGLRWYRTTGGSTGEPVGFWQDREVEWWEEAFVWRHWRWFGVAFADRPAICRGVRPPAGGGVGDPPRPGRGAIGEDPRLGLVLSAFELGWDAAPAYLDALARHRPAFLRGYPSALDLLARRAEADGRPPHEGLKAVFTSSELLLPAQRERIAVHFGAPVADLYGHAERAVAAGECPAGRLHVFAEYGWLEIDAPEGSEGEILATSFHNRAMPLVRYRTGDTGRLTGESCPCGRALPVLEMRSGRTQDAIVTPDGRRVSVAALNFHDDVFDAAERFRLVQERVGAVLFEYVPRPGAGALDAARVVAALADKLGPAIAIEIAARDRLDLPPSGKHRFVVSRLDAPAEGAP